jgi:hypothetical protein
MVNGTFIILFILNKTINDRLLKLRQTILEDKIKNTPRRAYFH